VGWQPAIPRLVEMIDSAWRWRLQGTGATASR
jgi:hypothetical protein